MEGVVKQLKEIDAGLEVLEHEKVLTVEAAQAALAGVEGLAFAKNLLFKDKNGKLIHIVALNSTEIDMKVLSLRLGLGKKHPRMAPAEALQTVYQVEAGCLTPLALRRPEAKDVVLLLDERLKEEQKVLFHPLRNDRSVVISTGTLEAYLSKIGRQGTYVDFQKKDFKLGKDNPPDLKPLLDAAQAYELGSDGAGDSKKGGKKAKGGKKGDQGSKGGALPAGDDVHALLREIQESLAPGQQMEAKVSKDLESRLNAFKNIAYTRGYKAARAEIRAHLN